MTAGLRDEDIVEVGAGVHLVHGSDTNWVVVKDGEAATLIDSGYPGDREALLASLAKLDIAPEAVRALLITHAHGDHIGAAEHLRTTYGTDVLMHEEEVPHARREFLHQVTVGKILARAWRPGVLPWAVGAVRSGGLGAVPVAGPRAFPVAGALDLPGGPVPVHTPGHTRGHCAYHLPEHGVLVSGDALVTEHPTSRLAGPQLLPGMFHADRARTLASLAAFEAIQADTLLAGHGPVYRGDVREAVARAREHAGA
ncbi:MBL fold metallo-hydrolase [Streptomyces sp. NPDC004959]|uniref:MBL fold metallo-hydrolase n=1 Tax=unclassified Streptomyces TaxID=2593676 RepID=UPI0004CBE024|nr:MBL fold metallo-hydrolase [Streptomyces sp. NRRL F-5630]